MKNSYYNQDDHAVELGFLALFFGGILTQILLIRHFNDLSRSDFIVFQIIVIVMMLPFLVMIIEIFITKNGKTGEKDKSKCVIDNFGDKK
jgi:hypothetical protein